MQGILLINKPVGWTSFDVVAYVRKTIAKELKVKPTLIKVGHSGTLDPMAKGLLVLLVGRRYTKQAAKFLKLDKEYSVVMKLGYTSPSVDIETKEQLISLKKPSMNQLLEALHSFKGTISQKPPAFSAIKVNGQRAYKLARSGKEVELKARPVNIYEIKLLDYTYPMVSFLTKVSSGTYIRSLVSDLGNKLETGAYMTSLERRSIGDFNLVKAIDIESITFDQISSCLISD